MPLTKPLAKWEVDFEFGRSGGPSVRVRSFVRSSRVRDRLPNRFRGADLLDFVGVMKYQEVLDLLCGGAGGMEWDGWTAGP